MNIVETQVINILDSYGSSNVASGPLGCVS